MPALMPTQYTGTIVWLGHVTPRLPALVSDPVQQIQARFSGIESDTHGGLTRSSCSRVVSQYPKGTEIRNTRQFSIVCAQEIAQIAAEMGIETLQPEWIGASVVISGLPDFSHIPPSSRLQTNSGATLTVDMQNRPCMLPAPIIDETNPGLGKFFKSAAIGRRGVTAWVEREGAINLGDTVTLHIPDQRRWNVL